MTFCYELINVKTLRVLTDEFLSLAATDGGGYTNSPGGPDITRTGDHHVSTGVQLLTFLTFRRQQCSFKVRLLVNVFDCLSTT